MHRRQHTANPQFFGSSWAPTPTGSVGSRRFLRRRQLPLQTPIFRQSTNTVGEGSPLPFAPQQALVTGGGTPPLRHEACANSPRTPKFSGQPGGLSLRHEVCANTPLSPNLSASQGSPCGALRKNSGKVLTNKGSDAIIISEELPMSGASSLR